MDAARIFLTPAGGKAQNSTTLKFSFFLGFRTFSGILKKSKIENTGKKRLRGVRIHDTATLLGNDIERILMVATNKVSILALREESVPLQL